MAAGKISNPSTLRQLGQPFDPQLGSDWISNLSRFHQAEMGGDSAAGPEIVPPPLAALMMQIAPARAANGGVVFHLNGKPLAAVGPQDALPVVKDFMTMRQDASNNPQAMMGLVNLFRGLNPGLFGNADTNPAPPSVWGS